jgi:hypothetical protein
MLQLLVVRDGDRSAGAAEVHFARLVNYGARGHAWVTPIYSEQ